MDLLQETLLDEDLIYQAGIPYDYQITIDDIFDDTRDLLFSKLEQVQPFLPAEVLVQVTNKLKQIADIIKKSPALGAAYALNKKDLVDLPQIINVPVDPTNYTLFEAYVHFTYLLFVAYCLIHSIPFGEVEGKTYRGIAVRLNILFTEFEHLTSRYYSNIFGYGPDNFFFQFRNKYAHQQPDLNWLAYFVLFRWCIPLHDLFESLGKPAFDIIYAFQNADWDAPKRMAYKDWDFSFNF